MGSMNNWLAFSLSPQEVAAKNNDDENQKNTMDEISIVSTAGGGHCFDLSSDEISTLPSSLSHTQLQLPPPFSILQPHAFNHSNEWNMNSSSMHGHQEPKLENFLGVGGHQDGDHQQTLEAAYDRDYMSSYAMVSDSMDHQIIPNAAANINNNINGGGGGSVSTNSSIGLSMIKTWLRNQPAPTTRSGAGATTQTLSLTMSSGGDHTNLLNNQQAQLINKPTEAALDGQSGAVDQAAVVPRKSIDTFGQRTSIYRGVTRHRWTGRYEAHLWDNSCRREGQTRKGRQVYLGGYDKEEKAARAYDLAALKYWGPTTTTNFPIGDYEKELEEMKPMTRQEFIASLRRKSSGFSRGASIYRGVTRHHQHGRWQARIGRVAGNKDLYLGTFSTQEEAAEAYDIAAIKFRGLNAVTNFEINRYDVKSILESSTLPIGGAAKRLKDVEQADFTVDRHVIDNSNMSSQLSDVNNYGWPTIAAYQQPQAAAAAAVLGMHHPYAQRFWCKQEQDVDNHNYQDLHLGNTHNFFQPTAMHQNYMSMDSSPVEHSSSSMVYGSGDHVQGNIGYHANVFPISTVHVASDGNQNQENGYGDGEVKAIGYDMYGSADPYQARNLYYPSHQDQQASASGPGLVKANMYDQGNTWVPTAVPATRASARSNNNMALVHGTQTFTVWNDT